MGARRRRGPASITRLALLVLALAPALLTIAATPAVACSCVAQTSVEHFARADVVFNGRLVEVNGPPSPRVIYSSLDPVIYQFEVEHVFKGTASANTSVHSVVEGGSCGLEDMLVGDRYTVFASTRDGGLQSSLCDGTYRGGPDAALVVVSVAVRTPVNNGPPLWIVALIGMGAVFVSAAIVWRARRTPIRG